MQHKHSMFKRVLGILVTWHISTGILTRIGRAILDNLSLTVVFPAWPETDTFEVVVAVLDPEKITKNCTRSDIGFDLTEIRNSCIHCIFIFLTH